MRILVIEDETILLKEVVRWLTLEGYETLGAADGQEGINLAFQHQPDLILCDIALPNRDGYDVMLEIRSNLQTQLTPFIYMTAMSSHDDIRKGMALGADDYVTKPFTRVELLQAVEAVLGKRLLQEQSHQTELEQWQIAFKHEHEQRIFKAKLVGMFSHEFRNPLASIMSSNGILRKYTDRMDENQREIHFNRIDNSVNRLLQMLEEMLVVAQIEAGSLNFKPEPLNIAGFIQEIIAEFHAICGEEHTITFKNRLASETMMADPRLLRQIATNLISNAIKYSPMGSEISVSLERSYQILTLSVQDYGIGIPESDQERLFTAFQRASNVGSVAGTGLGLAIVRQAAELHGGTIQLESRVGVGTTVTVRFLMDEIG
jgi:two-component system sensor histidine kinase/response regulator